MTLALGRLTGIYMDAFDLSSFCKSANSDVKVALSETTTFGQTFVSRIPNEIDGHLGLSGYWDGTVTTGIDPRADSQMAGADIVATLVFKADTAGDTGRAHLYQLRQANYKSEAAKGGAVTFSLDGDIDGQIGVGFMLHAPVAETSLATGTGYNIGGPGSTQITKYLANLHVLALTGSSPNITVKLQTSTSQGGTYADLVSFTAFTGTTGEQKTGTTTAVGPFVKYVATLNSGSLTSITYLVSVARLA